MPQDRVPRVVTAANPSPMTLDGTHTYLVGRARVAVVDPGPALPDHLDAIAAAVGGAAAEILLTHGHPDHAAGAAVLADRLGARVRSAALRGGDRFHTDAGDLVAVPTPGHTPDHFAFDWPDAGAVFVGDLMMGGQDTTLVARPEGDLGDYLASLERVRALHPGVLYPAHGPPFRDAAGAIADYVEHRRSREARIVAALQESPLSADALLDAVYGGELDARLREAARGATHAYLRHLEARGVVRLGDGGWALRS
ncbi:MAG TPA: MBL fold metallo-hydrolase [Longimicrobiales bacterium]|nr:MBL fold metallo-hydrolase [Longimicrobiales bacterium]